MQVDPKETRIRILQRYGTVTAFADTVSGVSNPAVFLTIDNKLPAHSLKAEIVRRKLREEGLLVELTEVDKVA